MSKSILPLPSGSGSLSEGQEKRMILTLMALQFVHICDFMVLMPLGPRIMESLHVDATWFALLVSVYTFSAGISGLFFAPMLDRVDRRRLLLGVTCGFLVATLACGLSRHVYPLLFARVAAGAFGGLITALSFGFVGEFIPYTRRGAAMGRLMTSFSLASVIGVPLSLFIANHANWQAPFLFLAGIGLIAAVGVALYLPPTQRQTGDVPPVWSRLSNLIFQKRNFQALAFTGTMMFSGFTVIPFISSSLVMNGGVVNEQLPWVYLLGGLATYFTLPRIGALSDRLGHHKVFYIASILTLIPMALITQISGYTIWWAVPVTTMYMVFSSSRMAPAMTQVTEAVVPAQRAGFMGVNTAMQQLASGLASLTAGAIIATGSDGHLLHYNRVGILAIAFLLISMFLARGVRPHSVTVS